MCWVFVSVWGPSPVAASGGHSSSRCAGLSLSRPLLLQSRGSRRSGSAVVAHRPSCSAACGIFPDQGSNPCPLHWQADSQPLRHQGSPVVIGFEKNIMEVKYLSHNTLSENIWHQSAMSLLMITLITWLRQRLPGFSIAKLLFFPFYILLN